MAEEPDSPSCADLSIPQLVLRLSARDQKAASQATAEILRRFEPLLRRTWHRLGGQAADYEDYRQEALLKLFRVLPQLRQLEAFPGFFARLSRTVAQDQLREIRRNAGAPLDDVDSVAASKEPMADIDTGIMVASLLQELRGREREVLYLDAVLGLTGEEISRFLGLAPSAARATKSRAINRIRGALKLGRPVAAAGKRRAR